MRIRPTHLLVLPLVAAVPASVAVVSLGQLSGPAAADAPAAAPSVVVAEVEPAQPRPADRAVTATATAVRPVGRPATVAMKVAVRPRTPAKPVAKPAARPATQRATQAGAKPATQPTTQPTTKPAATPAPKPAAPSVRQGRDDYPWRTATTDDHDDWGFTKRQCVSFAAFRLAQAGRALDNASEGWGSAKTWDDVARQRGRTVSTTPVVGSIAHWDAGESSAYYAAGSSTSNGRYTAGSYGHVGWVTHVYADGSAQVEAYNGSGDRSWSSMHVRAPRYLRL